MSSSLEESSNTELTERRLLQGVVVSDSHGVIRSVNDHVCRIFEWNKRDLLGKDIKMLMPETIRAQHDEYLANFLRNLQGKAIGSTRVVIGQKSNGKPVKLRLALSYIHGATPMFCALLEELVDRSFFVLTDEVGKILEVRGDPEPVLGRTAGSMEGGNITMMMTQVVANKHAEYMKNYKGARESKIIGKVRNLEARHSSGHVFPISLEVAEESSKPLRFRAKITEVEGTTEAFVNVNQQGIITSMSPSCKLLFGYDDSEMVGKHVKVISPNVVMATGQNVVACQHKDGSSFFVSVEIRTTVNEKGETEYHGILRRVLSNRPSKKVTSDATGEQIFAGDLLGWYEITKSLGSGYFGTVKMATHRLTQLNVAVKTLKRAQYKEAGMVYPPREIELIRKLNHPNICRLFDTIHTSDAIFMITEVVPGGELFDYVAQKDHLSEDEARLILRQLVAATDYMHRMGIAHRDLKMENILLAADGSVKVIDLGLGNFYDQTGQRLLNTFCGSADYAAPELWRGQKYVGPEVDIWSLGVVLFVITTGFIPFNDSNHIMNIRYHWPKARTFSEAIKSFVDAIFQPSDRRIKMEELINHRWLNDDGRLPLIERHALKLESSDIDEGVIQNMGELGFDKQDVRKQVLEDHHNQLTTTYYLLLHQKQSDVEQFSRKRPKPQPEHPEVAAVSPPAEHEQQPQEPNKSESASRHCIIS